MKNVTLRDLRTTYRAALLATPLGLVACRETSPVTTAPTASASATTAGTQTPPPPSGTAVASGKPKGCVVGPFAVTGCGGGEAALESSPESCGVPTTGDIPKDRCKDFCGTFETRACNVTTKGGGKLAVFCHAANPCLGRAPSTGIGPAAQPGSVREHLGLAFEVEALSAVAFRELRADLERWGAPATLLSACERAAADEARHARAMERLLERRGDARPPAPRRAPRSFGSLLELALHNEREGVVGETWGALVAEHQAEHAPSEDVREAMRGIAREESEHAALSFRVARWARRRLGPERAVELDEARREAFAELRTSLGYRPADDAARDLGWPSRAKSAAMLDVLAPLLA